jgi:bla regulator protein blaR1
MRTESRELLAVGIFGGGSLVGNRIEVLLRRGRTFSPRASAARIAASTVVLGALLAAGSFAPRWIAFAQAAPRLSFEVASVKPSGPNDPFMYRLQPGGRYIATAQTLKYLVANAYEVPLYRIAAVPGWSDSEKFNIEAKVGIPIKPWPDSNEQINEMLRSLLEERFKLAVHWETRQETVYNLVIAKGGSKLKTAADGESPGFEMEQGRIHSMAVPSSYLAGSLSTVLGRTVLDKTGLPGKFDYTLLYAPDGATPDDDRPSLYTALEQQLGLRLESSKGPVEFLMIDHVERPDAN